MLSSPYAEIKDSLAHFGADLKKSFVDSMKKTWKTLHEFALAHTSGEEEVTPAATDAAMEAVAEKLSQEQLQQKQEDAQHMRGELTFCLSRLEYEEEGMGRGRLISGWCTKILRICC